MRIAQVAPLYESVPPARYGGTERIVSYLTEELVREGHEVTLFASGDSRTRARLVAGSPRALRTDPECRDPLARHFLLLERVFEEARRFDVIHYHLDYMHFPFSRRSNVPHLTTLHGRQDHPDLAALYAEFDDIPLVSISNSQRRPIPGANWRATVPHGVPEELYRPGAGRGGYLAFLGRMSKEKRPDRAIEIARATGLPLRMAAKVDAADRPYFENEIVPLLRRSRDVHFYEEIGEEDKNEFLGDAAALLFPIDWPEPFGLVLIEALACGTPIVAFRAGAVDEIVEPGETGFVVESVAEAVEAVDRIHRIDRRRCRLAFERRFTAARMARDYGRVYAELRRGKVVPISAPRPSRGEGRVGADAQP
jgi:glycosyltransferase involved in cell wall biosynthesis